MNNLIKREPFSDEFFVSRNMIILWGEINEEVAKRVALAITYLDIIIREETEKGSPEQDIVLIICSPGGSVYMGFAIYDAINNASCDVQTICYGFAASMAAFLLSSGTKGKRCILPNAKAMIHQPLGGAQGQATDIEIRAREIVQLREKLNGILANNTGRTIEEIEVATERDNYLTAEEALEFGLVDKILYTVPKAFQQLIKEEIV